MALPSVSVIIPTRNATATLELALSSLRNQQYAGDVEILVVDGLSDDGTQALAIKYGARVVDNHARRQEEGCAEGVRAASGELLLFFDADDEAPHDRWLAALVAAMSLAPDIAAADPLFHEVQPGAPAINRLSALMGGTDPIAIDLGWSDRWGFHKDRWTGMPVEEEDHLSAIVVRIDPKAAPPMGSNGFLVRRDLVLQVGYDPFFHPEVVAEIAALGFRFARVRESIVHHFAPDTRTGLRKARARTTRTAVRGSSRKVTPPRSLARTLGIVLWSVSLVGPIAEAARGYRRCPDRAWALYPIVHLAWTAFYIEAYVRRGHSRLFAGQRHA